MLNNMNWIIGITLAIATKQQLTLEIRQRKIILQARNQTGIGDEEASKCNHVRITLGQYFFSTLFIEFFCANFFCNSGDNLLKNAGDFVDYHRSCQCVD